MHGVKWGTKITQEELDHLHRLSALADEALERRQQHDLSKEAEKLASRVLELNPDDYTLWNYRREQLRALCAEGISDDEKIKRWESELRLTTKGLVRHPKAYAAWQQRVWLLTESESVGIPLENRHGLMRQELELCAQFLRADPRNFHAWAHRERALRIAGQYQPEEAIRYTEECINGDFSNYSAWHYRSVSLVDGHPMRQDGADAVFLEEVDRLRQAFYTDPDAQSAWFYYRWLLNGAPYYSRHREIKNFVDVNEATLESELAAIEELIELEPESKWALLTKVYLLQRLKRTGEAKEVLNRLVEIDPMRKGYYQDIQAKQ